jgi:hypothetical protein
MKRMSVALARAAVARPLGPATDQALRWAAAWGMACGIRTPHTPLRLRRDTLIGAAGGPRWIEPAHGDAPCRDFSLTGRGLTGPPRGEKSWHTSTDS